MVYEVVTSWTDITSATGICYELVCLDTKFLPYTALSSISIAQMSFSVALTPRESKVDKSLSTWRNNRSILSSVSRRVNVLATSLMIGCLLYHRQRQRTIGGYVGNDASENIYVFLAKIFIETAALYTIANVLFIAILLGKPDAVDPFAFLAHVMAFIGPALVWLRVASGLACNATKTVSNRSSFGGRMAVSGQRNHELERLSWIGLYPSHQSFNLTAKLLQIIMSTHRV
jgi:hypothetical protein